MTLIINLLGGLAVEKDGSPLPKLISRKADVLLAYLAQEQRPHSRESLATLLWDDRSQKQALSNLRTLLSNLRKHVGDYVVITRSTVALNQEEDLCIDTAVFQQQLTFAQDNWPSPQAIAQAEEALALYAGDFLEGVLVRDSFELESWMQTTRDQLQHLAVNARQKLIDTYLQQGEFGVGIQHAAMLLQHDSLDESAHRQMMLLLARNGQRGAAIEQYETCRRILEEELGVEPEDETVTLFRRIELADSSPTGNIPAPLTTFIGRTKERLQISHLLREENGRLLTLIGLGGIGKTRLAIQIAHDQANNYLNGVYFVPLASVESPDFLVSAIAEALTITFAGNADPKTQLLNNLREKEALLVLDNFEHLLSGAPLLNDILQHAPHLKLLVTSRERLQLRAERLFELSGLPCPSGEDSADTDPNEYDSLQLFRERALLVDINFALTDGNYQSVGKICQLLQGMPLGIELAAAWVRAFSCDQILAQIEQNIDFLATQMRDVPERHRSLRAVFDYVWELLLPEERQLFVKLSLFRGGFDMAAATAVANVSPWTLVTLVEKSLLRKQDNNRYEMLEVLRRFAARMSETFADDIADGRAKHARYYADFLAEQAPLLNGRRTKEALEAITLELENCHASWAYAVEQVDFESVTRSVAALTLYYDHKGLFYEGVGLIKTAVTRFEPIIQNNPQPDRTHCDLLSRLYASLARLDNFVPNYDQAIASAKNAIRWGEAGGNIKHQATGYRLWGWYCYRKGTYDEAVTHVKKGTEMAQASSDVHEEAACGRALSAIYVRQGNYQGAADSAQHARKLFREVGDLHGEAKALNMLGVAYWYLGDYDTAKAYYQQALFIYQELGNIEGENFVLGNLGLIAAYQRHYDEAARLYQKILTTFRQTSDSWAESWVLNSLGILEAERFHFTDALRYCGDAVRLAGEIGARGVESDGLKNLGYIHWQLGNYPQADLYYQRSMAIQDELKDAHDEGILLHNRSLLAYEQGDYVGALDYARQALTRSEAHDDLLAQAASLTALGNSLVASHAYDEAQSAYQRALSIWESMKLSHRSIDTQAGLIRIALAQEDIEQAMRGAEKVLTFLEMDSIEGVLSPLGTYLACIQALLAANDPRADTVLAEARRLLGQTAVMIENPALRNSYLQNVPAHRALLAL